jgi:Zn-dependent metalloprotease
MSPKRDGFTQPPWVMGSPKEVMDWIEASNPDKKDSSGKKQRKEDEFLTNVKINFDFDVNRSEIKPTKFLSKILGKKMILEDFELLQTAEIILRGLAKAKFKNIAKIVVDGTVLYEHPEKKTDLRKTIDNISEYSREISKGNKLEVRAILDAIEECTAIIKIKKIHSKKEKSIDIHMKGRIKKTVYHTFLNYLDEKIGFKAED